MYCLVKCKIISPVWFASPLCLRTQVDSALYSSDWIKSWCNIKCLSNHEHGDILSIIVIFSWNIWMGRKKTIFDKMHFNMFNSTFATLRMLNESHACPNSFFSPDERIDSFGWKLLVGELIKVNFDGTFCSSLNVCDAGVVVRDDKGTFLHAKLEGCFADTSLVAQCYATHLALSRVHALGLKSLIF